MTPRLTSSCIGPAIVALCLLAVALALGWPLLTPALRAGPAQHYDIPRMVLVYATLPRLATAILAGAALSLSGALFQIVLRNPLADPTTLGVSAGANLALVLTMLFFPALLGLGRDVVALIGSAVVAILVVGLGARRGFSPFSLVLAGLVISLWCGALSAVLMLLNSHYLVSLFIWGAGSLAQQSWDIPISLLWKLAVIATGCALIIRPLSLLELGEDGASARGLRLQHLRALVIACGVALAALVTSAVGVIGFIGLVAPTIARLSGARRPAALLVWSSVTGALLLLVADETVQLLAGDLGDFLPTGAVTAVFGSPLLLLMLPKLRIRHRLQKSVGPARPEIPPLRSMLWAALLLTVLAVAISLMLGRPADGGWGWLSGDLLNDILPMRAPKVFSALASGAMLSVAGVVLQRLTGNEMASPEVLGINAGAVFGVAIAVFCLAAPGLGSQLGFAAIGAIAVITMIFLFSVRSGFAPERVLLAGISLSAMVDAVVGVMTTTGDPRALLLMRWMSGSTYNADMTSTIIVSGAAIALIAVALSARRWLDILPLGGLPAASVGVCLSRSRLALFCLAGLMSAAATLSVGPLSFIGLMGPHLAREAGLLRALPQMAGAAAIGGILMVVADFIGRTVAFPYQIPAGLVSALVGAPFLIWMLRRKA